MKGRQEVAVGKCTDRGAVRELNEDSLLYWEPAEPDAPEGRDSEGADARSTIRTEGGSTVKVLEFSGLDVSGRLKSPQLLYFLERANEELERASLEKRSFIPHMVRSVEEEQL